MHCLFGIIGVAIIWPASGYFLLGMLGWLGLKIQEKILRWLKKPNDWLDKKIPILKFKNTKPFSKNFPNIIENIFIKFPLRLIVTLPIILSITAIFLAITFYAVMGMFSCWSDKEVKLKPNDHGIKYELISEEKLEKACAKGECSTTVKKILSSNDGFIFETYTSDGSDSVWCGKWSNNSWVYNKNPCSTVGDYGGGGEDIIVTNKKTNKQITVSGNGVQLLRIPTPLDYPNLVFRLYTGGASCCGNYILYNKATLAFISDTKKNKYDKW